MNSINLSGLKYSPGAGAGITEFYGGDVIRSEVSEDYIIPDYIADVKRVLGTFARPVLKSKYIGDGNLSLEGDVIVTTLLLSENGAVKSVTLSLPFNIKEAASYLPDTAVPAGGYTIIAAPSVEGAETRLANPRKYTVRVKLAFRPEISFRTDAAPVFSGLNNAEDEAGVERNVKQTPSMNLSDASGQGFTLSEDIEIDASLPPAKEILYTGVEINFTEYRKTDSQVTLTGEAAAIIIYTSEDDETITLVRRIPVSATVDAEKLSSDCEFFGGAVIESIKANIENNSYGEARIIELDVNYDVDMMCASNETTEILKDIYSVDYDSQTVFADRDIYSVRRCSNSNFSVNAGKDRKEVGAENAKEVLFASATVNIGGLRRDAERGRLVLEGSADVTAVVKNADDGLAPIKFTVPIKYEPDVGEVPRDFKYACRAAASNVRGRLDSGNIYCDFEVLLGLLLIGHVVENAVASVTFDTSHKVEAGDRPAVLLYYPQPGEGLWDIAKRYRSMRGAITAANNLASDKVSDQRVLMIPRKEKSRAVFSKII